MNKDKLICFDTETTGLDSKAEICQLSVIDSNETILFDKLIKPSIPIPEIATKIHGITNEQVALCNPFKYYSDFILDGLFKGKIIIGYNVFYDVRMLQQSICNSPDRIQNFSSLMVIDVMQFLKEELRIPRYFKLQEAYKFICEKDPEKDTLHNSLYDSIYTVRVFNKLMERKQWQF
jgi:DNA polymerase III epsilon subunit-like protein